MPEEPLDAAQQDITDALADLLAGRVRTRADLEVCLELLELAPYRDAPATVEPARIAGILAEEVGDAQLQARVRLIQADLLDRAGKAAEAAQLLFATSAWAKSSGNPHVRARSHYHMSAFYRRVGDAPSELEHALYAVEFTPAEVRPELRAEHLLMVALAFDDSGNLKEAARRYEEVVELSRRIGHPWLSLVALNNVAWLRCIQNQPEEAALWVGTMLTVAEAHNYRLPARHVDTMAKVKLMLGFPQKALDLLQSVLSPAPGDPPLEAEGVGQCLLTAAEAYRALNDVEHAQQTLDRMQRYCDEQQLESQKVEARMEQAQLYASAGRFEEAYLEYRAFHAASEALHSAESESRARILQVAMGEQEARRDSEHFRELSLRDPLTGLRNRRFVNTFLDDLLESSARLGEVVSVAMLDLDHFKRINDTLSHDAGDAVLVQFASLLEEATVADGAVAARLGGEEFLVILPGSTMVELEAWAARMLACIRAYDWSPLVGRLPVTTSIGLGTAGGAGSDREQLLRLADENLYAAKHAGRDRAVGPAGVVADESSVANLPALRPSR